jgi:hypothetical protein
LKAKVVEASTVPLGRLRVTVIEHCPILEQHGGVVVRP